MQKLLPTYFFAALTIYLSACSNNATDESPSVISANPLTTTVIQIDTITTENRNAKTEIVPEDIPDNAFYVSIMPIPDCLPPCEPPTDIKASPSLAEILSNLAPKPQKFSVNNSNGEIITCLQGTELIIPKDAFTANGKEIYIGDLTFAVTEYYDIADIVTAKLHTLGDAGILESGGMVYLEAIAGNTKLELMPGKQIEIKFADEKEDMGIFYLKETDSNSVWYAAQNVIKPAEESNVIYTYYGPPARFPGGGVEMQNYFKNNLKYPDLDKYPTLDGVVIISCIIDSNGYVTNSAIKKSLHPAYDSIALKVIAEMPQWKPATQDDKFVNTNYDIPVRFDALDMAIVQMDKKASKTKRNKQEQASGEINPFTLEGMDTLIELNNKITELTQTRQGLALYSDRILATANLGFVNCDRYIQNNVPNTNVVVSFPTTGETQWSLIVNGARIVINGRVEPALGRGEVRDIDYNLDCTIFALRNENGQLSYCLKTIKTGSKKPVELAFTQIEPSQMFDVIEKINSGNNLTLR